MSETLREYLADNKPSIDAAVNGIVKSIWSEHDEEGDREGLTRDALGALTAAIGDMLEKGPVEGSSYAVVGSIAISIYRPKPGQELFNRLTFQVGRLTGGGAIMRPKSWPEEATKMPHGVEQVMSMIGGGPLCPPPGAKVD